MSLVYSYELHSNYFLISEIKSLYLITPYISILVQRKMIKNIFQLQAYLWGKFTSYTFT